MAQSRGPLLFAAGLVALALAMLIAMGRGPQGAPVTDAAGPPASEAARIDPAAGPAATLVAVPALPPDPPPPDAVADPRLPPATQPDGQPAGDEGDEGEGGEGGEPAAAPAQGGGSAASPPPPSAQTEAMRIAIPSLGVEARVISLGVTGDGVMEVPLNARDVGWYHFTSTPGDPGNAVFAGHVDWAGSLGVFNRLEQLDPGDEVQVLRGGERLRYRVEERYRVDPDTADVTAIVGGRTGPETVTLITCGGVFNRQTRDYEERVIVRAVRIDG